MSKYATIANGNNITCIFDETKISYMFRETDTRVLLVIDSCELHWNFKDKETCDEIYNKCVKTLLEL